ncbi:SIS domain-containing protein [Kushneria phyllosphaerae]|uniref:Glutamine--fructose-6-phosphate aminotransferase [isomerizing] n=1 Tax=Kushneria phyllosphaerae TaxID=2100822 RepID=A0A2R8CKF2_9GAMM|nr:SIS domain-containing protein [Kushneria phyllosphaerae]SPJ33380.1 Glutamine--fructose-6-phosphate aminotransferase [isomerizing] [Kushneria phyllosphaerae]
MSLMRDEALSAPQRIAEQWRVNRDTMTQLGEVLRHRPLHDAMTVARGSSDHAAGYFARLMMQMTGRPCASLPLSLCTLDDTAWQVEHTLALAVSQSGRSPDLVEAQKALKGGGALSLAMVNAVDSPLAHGADHVIDLQAGEEKSVAATKSFLATLSASASVMAHWQQDRALLEGLAALPESLAQACRHEWHIGVDALRDVDKLLVIGRGAGLPIAQEAALKFKETCVIQAEAFSGAEVQHGPMALVGRDYPVLILAPKGKAQKGLVDLADTFRARGARVLLAADAAVASRDLTIAEAPHDALAPLCAIQSFYLMIEALSRVTGHDPDRPEFLNKVTQTR